MSGFHWHKDPDWEIHGANAYHQCRCGARRVKGHYRNLASPVTPGWPHLVDCHGRGLSDTGWVKEPTEGWPNTDHRRIPIRPPGGGSGVSRSSDGAA